ncbi:helix-turn-helix transcriptional regulator [Berryella wangjianweii]|uniref:helix-turn-helix transcriptional regulator n=1 Tax=Berryella wangjianweii TaxID=2734634 RepID=UPI0021BD6927|nr:helix-turn-helix transcriptional regulator [Berryella wangjianweii]
MSIPHHSDDRAASPPLRQGARARALVVDGPFLMRSLGLALCIAWTFVFWNGSLLFEGVRAAVPLAQAQAVQAVLTAVAALMLAAVLGAASSRARLRWFGALALVSSGALTLAALAGWGDVPAEAIVGAFALSGVGSCLRLGWEERFAQRGVTYAAAGAVLAYLLGFGLFVVVSLLPVPAALAVSLCLPLASWGLMALSAGVLSRASARAGASGAKGASGARGKTGACDAVRGPRSASFPGGVLRRIPLRLMAALALAFFGYGAMRAGGVEGGLAVTGALQSLSPGAPALASCSAIVLAWLFYRWKPVFAFYLAFPLIAVASVVPAALDPLGGGVLFSTALVGAEVVKYLVLFALIDLIVRDGLPALVCLAVMRAAQWAGSFLGQASADALGDPGMVTIAVLIALIAGLLVLVGQSFPAPMGAAASRDAEEREGGAAEGGSSGGRLPEPSDRASGAAGPLGLGGCGEGSSAHGPGPDAGVAEPIYAGEASGARPEAPGDAALAPGDSALAPGSDAGAPGVPDASGADGFRSLSLEGRIELMAARCRLSSREREVLAIWATGHTAAYVEERLRISKSTIKTHLNHIYAKTGTRNRDELLRALEDEATRS